MKSKQTKNKTIEPTFDNSKKNIVIYTDGYCESNPSGKGGLGAVVINGETKEVLTEILQGFHSTTNNRMEVLAGIYALESLVEPSNIIMYSDSQYFINSASSWVFGWLRKGFVGKKNVDLWYRYLAASVQHTIRFVWVKGHNGDRWNEHCDDLAEKALTEKSIIEDEGYDINKYNSQINFYQEAYARAKELKKYSKEERINLFKQRWSKIERLSEFRRTVYSLAKIATGHMSLEELKAYEMDDEEIKEILMEEKVSKQNRQLGLNL